MDIRTYRKKHGLSQNAFGELVRVTQPTVSQWECGLAFPSGRTAARIIELTHGEITLEGLFGKRGAAAA